MKKRAVLISCFGWYENRLKYVEQYLTEQGFCVEVLLSDFNHITKHKIDTLSAVNVHYLNTIAYKRNLSIKRLVSHVYFAKEVYRLVMQSKPDFVWCMVPPNTLVKKLSTLRKKESFQLIYDVIDLWPENMPMLNSDFFLLKPWKELRNRYIGVADSVVLECDYYRDILARTVDSAKFHTLRLFKKKIITNVEHISFKQDICIAYLGSINAAIDIERIIDTICLIGKCFSVLIRIVGKGESKNEFVTRIHEAGAEVEDYGCVFDEMEKARILGNCHFGLNIYKKSIMVGLTMKSVDYFQLGIPILNSIPGDTAKLVDEYQVGINLEDFTQKRFMNSLKRMDELRINVRHMFLCEFCDETVPERLSFLNDCGALNCSNIKTNVFGME